MMHAESRNIQNESEESTKANVVLVDGSGFIFRAFYAVPHLSTSTGFPTNALLGYSRMLVKLLNELSPEYCSVIFDAARANFRHEIYPDYKANRDEMPETLRPQIPFFPKISSALGLPTYSLEGYEADDLIGTMTRLLNRQGTQVTIVTGDKDLAQLVNPLTKIFDPMKDHWFDESAVVEKYGIPAEQFIDYLALLGDTSDNIPGVKGVGPKGAVALLKSFGSVEALIEDLPKIEEVKGLRGKAKIRQAIEDNVDQLRISHRLAAINCEVPLSEFLESDGSDSVALLDELQRVDANTELVAELNRELEFKDLLSGLVQGRGKAAPSVEDKFDVQVITPGKLSGFLSTLKQHSEFCFDLETTSLDSREAEVVGISFSYADDCGYYLPCGHVDENGTRLEDQFSCDELLAAFKPIMEDPEFKKVGQNLKYDVSILEMHGVHVRGIAFDTMLAAYVISPDSSGFSMDKLAHEYLHYKCKSYLEVTEGVENFSQVPLEAAAFYAVEDAVITWRLKELLEPKLEEHDLKKVFYELEMPLVRLLAKMEIKGISVDLGVLEHASAEWGEQLDSLKKQIYEIAGEEFNINSTKQLAGILFDVLQIPTKGVKKTKTGFSTDSSVLEKLALDHTLPQLVLEYRLLNKLKTTYVDALPKQVAETGRIHSSFKQTGTGTGRLSSSDPNLQNIPIATAQGRRIREAFVADVGKFFVAADYSQVELRILAHLSEDERLITAFAEEMDIHAQTARELLEIAPEQEVTKEERRIGKTLNFGIIYGMGAFRLGQELGIPFGQAKAYIDRYFERYAGVREFFEACKAQAVEQGEVRTIFGRRRLVSDLARSSRDKGFLERVAMNAPIQGSAADLVKLAMIRVDDAIEKAGSQAELVLQVHDELIYEVREEEVEEFSTLLDRTMTDALSLRVPLAVDVHSAATWHGLK